MPDFTHFDSSGAAHMVDVSDKPVTRRVAVAAGLVRGAPATLRMIADGAAGKGDVLGTARLAGIMGAKKTSDLIPLCHPLPLSKVSIAFDIDHDAGEIRIEATVKTSGPTGVEMEALTAVGVAALTIYDMCKAVDKAMTIDGIRLMLKEGGKSGRFEAPEGAAS